MPSDGDLVRRVCAGETERFRVLVERYQDAVYAVALSKTGNAIDAEDLAQETFIAAYQSIAGLKNGEKFGSWVYGIALNKVKMYLRSRSREGATVHEPASTDGSSEVARRELRSAVMEALARLSDANRETAVLFYINGYSQAEIAAFTDRPLGTVKRRLHDARGQLKRELIDMVETDLKGARPATQFTDRIVERISKVQVRFSGELVNDCIVLTDAKGRSVWKAVTREVALAMEARLDGPASTQLPDMHAGLLGVLDEFGWSLEAATLTDKKGAHFFARVALRRGRERAEVLSAPLDAITVARYSGAPILIDEALIEEQAVRRKDGTPVKPSAALRHVGSMLRRHNVRYKRATFKTASAAIRALERNPGDHDIRRALAEAAPGFRFGPPKLESKRNAWSTLKRWVERSEGTEYEALSASVMGSSCVGMLGDAEQALPYYEAAHQADPNDSQIAFEFATAYAMTNRADEALAVLGGLDFESHGLPNPTEYGNFHSLWGDERFIRQFGRPDPRCARILINPIIAFITTVGVHAQKLPRPTHVELVVIGARRKQLFEERVGAGSLLRVSAVRKGTRRIPNGWRIDPGIVLDIDGDRGAGWVPKRNEGFALTAAYSGWDDERLPTTAETAIACLKAAGLKLEAVVLARRTRAGIEAMLAVRNKREARHALVPIAAAAGLTLALTAKCPVLITEQLAEKLYIRGKNDRPLSPRGALRRLSAK